MTSIKEKFSDPLVQNAMADAGDLLQDICHGLAREAGWWDNLEDVPTIRVQGTAIALIHSEVSEALEGFRKNLTDDHLPNRPMAEVELADVIIRCLDLAGAFDLDVPGALVEKLIYNQSRQDHKPENRAADGGKQI